MLKEAAGFDGPLFDPLRCFGMADRTTQRAKEPVDNPSVDPIVSRQTANTDRRPRPLPRRPRCSRVRSLKRYITIVTYKAFVRLAPAALEGVFGMATTFEVLYLGIGPRIDDVEGNNLSENDSVLVGQTYGSSSEPLAFGAQSTLSPVDFSGGTTNMYDVDNTLSYDTFSIDGGPPQTLDGLAVYNATITDTDEYSAKLEGSRVSGQQNGRFWSKPLQKKRRNSAISNAMPIAR